MSLPESSLEQLFQETFEDRTFTRAERQSLRKVLQDEGLTARELAVLRAKIFDMARADLESFAAEQVVAWLENANKLLLPPKESRIKNRVFFSPGEECLNAILSLIQGAIHTLDICVFTISDNRISREVENSFRRKVKVRIITDIPKLHDKGSDIYYLASKGIPVRIDDFDTHMHHKFAIADDKSVLTGSYNWTRSAAQANEENLLVTDDPHTIKAFQKEFNRLWEIMHDFHPS
jgi:phosphatidylserine/phosphatidylglycerophosphate/cardiolipin synthase-like enzyme